MKRSMQARALKGYRQIILHTHDVTDYNEYVKPWGFIDRLVLCLSEAENSMNDLN